MTPSLLNYIELPILGLLLIQQFRIQRKIDSLTDILEDLVESQQSSAGAEQDLNRRLAEIQTMRFSSMVHK